MGRTGGVHLSKGRGRGGGCKKNGEFLMGIWVKSKGLMEKWEVSGVYG